LLLLLSRQHKNSAGVHDDDKLILSGNNLAGGDLGVADCTR
jgi:hypothetical protein